jgi:acyl-CoA synthetase (AMP-forming)/AMP-acid ligase II
VGREEVEVLDMDAGTVRCAANYAPLTPISFIERAAAVYGDRPAVVYGEARPTTWREARERCVRVAGALAARLGVARGDVVSAQPDKLPPVCRAVVVSVTLFCPFGFACLFLLIALFV